MSGGIGMLMFGWELNSFRMRVLALLRWHLWRVYPTNEIRHPLLTFIYFTSSQPLYHLLPTTCP